MLITAITSIIAFIFMVLSWVMTNSAKYTEEERGKFKILFIIWGSLTIALAIGQYGDAKKSQEDLETRNTALTNRVQILLGQNQSLSNQIKVLSFKADTISSNQA